MKVLKWLNHNLEKYMCGILFSIIIAIMLVNIFMRFVMRNAIPWASDAVLFIFVWFVWFTISYGFQENGHVRVTAIVDLLPLKIKKAIEFATNIMILAGFAILLNAAIKLLGDSSVVGKTGLLIKYPMWSLYLSTVVGLVLSLIRIVQNMHGEIKIIKEGGN